MGCRTAGGCLRHGEPRQLPALTAHAGGQMEYVGTEEQVPTVDPLLQLCAVAGHGWPCTISLGWARERECPFCFGGKRHAQK